MAAALYTDDQLVRLGAAIHLPRERFAEIYDPLAMRNGGDPLKVVQALAGRDPTPFFSSLTQANKAGWLKDLLLQLLHAGAFPDDVDEGVRIDLHGIVDQRAGFQDPTHLNMGVIRAVRRVCRISVSTPQGEVSGTGFLVGPQTVLTSWHVIRELLDATGEPKEGSHKGIQATFDQLSGLRGGGEPVAMASRWHIRSSPTDPAESPPNAQLDFAQNVPAGFERSLDFALLRLASPVGRQRGYYTLDGTRKPITVPPRTQVTLFQHPAGGSMKIANGSSDKMWPPGLETRMWHSASAMEGSSGGLILDADWQPVALHQCGYRDAAGKATKNGAIPTACIVAASNDVAFSAVEGTDPIWRIGSTGQPVLGRDAFQEAMERLAGDHKRIISISGEKSTGKTFCIAILRAVLGVAEHVVIELKPNERSAEPVALAQMLLDKAGVAPDAPALPVPADAETAQDAWVRDFLYPALVQGLKACAGTRKIWLILDNLDTNGLANTSSRQLLEALYREIGSTPFLRVVLVGLRGLVPGGPHGQVEYHNTTTFHLEDVVRYIERRTVECGHARSDQHIRELAQAVMHAARGSQQPLVPAVDEAVKLILDPILDQ